MPYNFHREAPPIPTDPAERKALVEWITNHPLWSRGLDSEEVEVEVPGITGFDQCVDIDFAYVDPTTREANGRPTDTQFEVWIEAGGWEFDSTYNQWCRSHDMLLDCGSRDGSLETALIELARRVKFIYGDTCNTRPDAPNPCWREWEDNAVCVYGEDGFCNKCGYAR